MTGPDAVHLNRDDTWRGFTLRDLDVVGGRLRLAALPAAVLATTGPAGPAAPAPDEPCGIAVAPDGTVLCTGAGATIVRTDGCDGGVRPFPCLGGEDDEPTQLREPGGLLVHPARGALLVADTGNGRVEVADLRTGRLLDVWDGYDRPVDLDADQSGDVYVLDRGARRLDRRTAGGEVVPGFADTLGTPFDDPVAVAVSAGPEGATVCVLDRARSSLHLLGTDGGYHREIALTAAGTLSGLAVTARAVYVGEAGSGVVAFRWTGERVGVAAGMPGPVGALALDGRGGLVVHPGGAAAPVRLLLDAAFVRHGVAWGGPFGGFSLTAKCWQRLVATWRSTGPGAHATVYVHTTDDPVRPPAVDPGSPDPFADRDWSPGPPDLDEFLVRRPPARYAWVGVHLTGDGTATTELEQIRLELDRPGYAEDLPAIYREDGPDAFLPRFLALAQGLFGEVEDATTGLTRLLDAAAAPEPFLDALARWLAVDPPVGRDVPGLRDAVAGAYREYGARGTVAGLRQAVRRGVGVDVLIEEPILAAGWWALVDDEGATDAERECSVLGVSTMLSAAEPQGAVLGTTATLDRSHLIEGTEYGMPAFDAVAHRFTARLYRGATYSAQRRAAVTALLERERPAHIEFNVCCVEPGLAVGTARVGIDAVLCGGATPDGRAGAVRIGDDAVLGGEPPGRIGERSAVGVTTRLGSGAVTDR